MTECVLDGDYREIVDGVIDIDKTVERLKRVEHLLETVSNSQY
jgi:hypothetical protein